MYIKHEYYRLIGNIISELQHSNKNILFYMYMKHEYYGLIGNINDI